MTGRSVQELPTKRLACEKRSASSGPSGPSGLARRARLARVAQLVGPCGWPVWPVCLARLARLAHLLGDVWETVLASSKPHGPDSFFQIGGVETGRKLFRSCTSKGIRQQGIGQSSSGWLFVVLKNHKVLAYEQRKHGW